MTLQAFQRAVPNLDADYVRRLESVDYQWATVLVLALDRPLSSIYWLTVTDPDCPFVVAVEQTNFRSPSEYGGQHVIYFSNYTDPGDPIIDENDPAKFARHLFGRAARNQRVEIRCCRKACPTRRQNVRPEPSL